MTDVLLFYIKLKQLNSFVANTDLEALKSYVTAKDDEKYKDLPEGIIVVDMTHNYIKAKELELRLDLNMTVYIY